jgi:hypothetical protein
LYPAPVAALPHKLDWTHEHNKLVIKMVQ